MLQYDHFSLTSIICENNNEIALKYDLYMCIYI